MRHWLSGSWHHILLNLFFELIFCRLGQTVGTVIPWIIALALLILILILVLILVLVLVLILILILVLVLVLLSIRVVRRVLSVKLGWVLRRVELQCRMNKTRLWLLEELITSELMGSTTIPSKIELLWLVAIDIINNGS